MLKIGITGGIGSGKSTVCNLFHNLGVPVFYSDIVGREILNTDDEVKLQVIRKFGRDIYTSEGKVDRERMASIVFSDPISLELLSGIVHPKVAEAFNIWVEDHELAPYVIKEAAILFESGSYHDLDKIINIFSPKELRIKRVMERDNMIKEDVLKRMRYQYSDEERNKLSDLIIVNEDINELLPQVMEMHELLLNETKVW